MNQRDIAQLKRRLNPEKRNPTVIRGCYVDHAGQVISTFARPIYHLPAEENEKYMKEALREAGYAAAEDEVP